MAFRASASLFLSGFLFSPCLISAIFTTDECGTTKSCMRLPDSCSPSDSGCTFLSWKWDSASSNFNFELSGGAGNGLTYSAVGFGELNQMVDADTYYCTGTELVSAAITTLRQAPVAAASNAGLSNIVASTADSVAQCTFTRAASVTKASTSGTIDYDLSSGNFYILLAHGSMSSGSIAYHGASGRIVSDSSMDLTAVPATDAPSTETTSPAGDGCGTTKGCFQVPSGCSKTDANCIFFSWFWNTETNLFEMELSGGSGNGDSYAAIAFGTTNKMQDADLYFCTGSSSGLGTGAIRANQAQPEQQGVNSVNGLTQTSSGTNGGVGQCKFTRVASVTKTITTGAHDFDLTKQQYYLLAARGAVSNGVLEYHQSRDLSSNRVDLMQFSGAGSAGLSPMYKAHGALMVLAWLMLANIGAVMARHFKPLYPDTKPGGKQLWFQVHRSLMATAFLATVIGFIIIFVEVNGFVGSQSQTHGIIGIVVMALAITNPILAFFRPHPNTPNRPIFNWSHYLVGTSARTLGIANLFLGVGTAPVERFLDNWIYILAGFCGFLVLIELIMEVVSWHYGHIANKCTKKEEQDPAPAGTLEMSEQNVRVGGQGVKTFLLVVYILGLAGFSIAFFVVIGGA